MRSKITTKILSETKPDVRENVRLRQQIVILKAQIEDLKMLLEIERNAEKKGKQCPF